MHLYLQLTRSLAVTLIWIYCNKLVLCYVRLRVSDPGQVLIPQPWDRHRYYQTRPREASPTARTSTSIKHSVVKTSTGTVCILCQVDF